MKISNRQMVARQRQAGFTLIEIMVVVIIIGLLSAMILPNMFAKVDQATIIKAKNDISKIESSMSLYRLDNFSYPSTAEGIQALVTNPGKSTWTGYLDKTPKDPWNNDYQYANPGTNNPDKFDLWTLGSDGAPGGEGAAFSITQPL